MLLNPIAAFPRRKFSHTHQLKIIWLRFGSVLPIIFFSSIKVSIQHQHQLKVTLYIIYTIYLSLRTQSADCDTIPASYVREAMGFYSSCIDDRSHQCRCSQYSGGGGLCTFRLLSAGMYLAERIAQQSSLLPQCCEYYGIKNLSTWN